MDTSDERMLSHKQQRFADEYLKDFNGKQAAIRAGYSAKTAEVQGSRLLRNAQVAAAIDKATKELSEKSGITVLEIVKELRHIGESDIGDLFDDKNQLRPINRLPDNVRRAIASVEIVTKQAEGGALQFVHKIRFWDKNAALATLAKYRGMLKDQVEHSGTDGKPIRVVFGGRYRPSGAASRR